MTELFPINLTSAIFFMNRAFYSISMLHVDWMRFRFDCFCIELFFLYIGVLYVRHYPGSVGPSHDYVMRCDSPFC